MSYQVLARKYRSQSFDQMIGQNHVSQTLLNALKNGRLPHALLFTGIRGTGKTSSARILAKSIRCQNAVNFVPCGVCNDCVEITAGKSLDVIEIDGASNNGVDSIRELRDSVMFSSSTGKYKIFIIDEVHMLSTSAFNALLKTLEEPPEHVIFIMATTEIQKIPQTILSRCQRFDFKRVTIKELTKHLAWICQQENISIEEKALWLIARQGEGSVRDSLSLLDQVINFSAVGGTNAITSTQVSQILGLTERSLVYEAYDALLHRKPEEMVLLLEKISKTSFNSVLFIEDLLRLFRHGILIKSSKTLDDSQFDLPKEEIEQLQSLVAPLSLSDLHMLFDMALKSLNEVSRSYDPLLVLEVSLLRMAQAPLMKDLKDLLASGGPALNSTTSRISNSAPAEAKKKVISEPKPVNVNTWVELVHQIKKEDSFLGAKVENLAFAEVDLEAKQIHFEVGAAYGFLTEQMKQAETTDKLKGFIDSFFGHGYTFTVTKTKQTRGDSVVVVEQKREQKILQEREEKWLKDSRIQKAQEVFKGKAKLVNKVD